MTNAAIESPDALGKRPGAGSSREVAPRVSVIVPVHDRPEELSRLIDSLGGQTCGAGAFELLICDDGSAEPPLSAVARAEEVHGLCVVHLRQQKAGPGAARNLGMANARGEILAFTDSDCSPAADWIEEIIRAFSSAGETLVGGPVGYRDSRFVSGRCVNFLLSSTLGGWGGRDPRCLAHVDFYPSTSNLAVLRDAALAAGGFPSRYYGEDIEFGHRVACRSGRPRFVERIVVSHDERRGLAETFKSHFRKGIARIRLRDRCGLHEASHAIPAALVLYLVALAVALSAGFALPAIDYVPLAAYGLVLAALAIQGAWMTVDPRVAPLLPAFAVSMHLGYGLGYLAARTGLVRDREA